MHISNYKAGDETLILKLFKKVFKKKMSADYWKWRFLYNPNQNQPLIYLMWDKDLLVGHYAVSPVKMLIDGKVVFSALSMTTMTDSNYAGKGIFTTLAKELYKVESENNQLDLVWGFPNNNSHRGFIKNLSWQDVELIPSFSLDVARWKDKTISADEEFSIVKQIDSRAITNYQKLQKDYHIKVYKDEAYFKWRYVDNPVNDYYIFENNNGAFFIAKQYSSSESTQIDIVEWAITNNFEETQNALSSLMAFFKNKPDHINIWMPLADKRHLLLEKLGFTNQMPITYLGYCSLNKKLSINKSGWFFQMGDSDVY